MLKCKNCGGEISVINFFSSDKSDCPKCNTTINFNDIKAYKIWKIVIEILSIVIFCVFSISTGFSDIMAIVFDFIFVLVLAIITRVAIIKIGEYLYRKG